MGSRISRSHPIPDEFICPFAGLLPQFGRTCCPDCDLAPILISNNTAPVHIAAAVGTPVVDLYALTNPQHTPWQVPHRLLFHDVPCKYCYKSVCPEGHHNCLRQVSPGAIVTATCELLAESARSPQIFHAPRSMLSTRLI